MRLFDAANKPKIKNGILLLVATDWKVTEVKYRGLKKSCWTTHICFRVHKLTSGGFITLLTRPFSARALIEICAVVDGSAKYYA